MNTAPSPLEQHRRKTRVMFAGDAQSGIRGGVAARAKKSLSKEDEKLLAFLLNPANPQDYIDSPVFREKGA